LSHGRGLEAWGVSSGLAHDLLNEIDYTAPEFGVFDQHECFGESKPVVGGKKLGDII
jgi:hypothetical protein